MPDNVIGYQYKPRILFVSHSGDLYGAERSLLTLVRGLHRLGTYDIMVYLPADGPLARMLDDDDIAFRVIPYTRWIGLRYHSLARYYRRNRNRLWLGGLVREAERWMPDLIYTNTIATPVGAMMAERLSPRPLHIWHARELPGERSSGFGMFDYGRETAMAMMARSSDCFICNSRFLHDRLVPGLQRAAGTTTGIRTEIVYNGLEVSHPEAPSADRPERSGVEPVRLIMAGGVSPVKNYGEAVEGIGILDRSGVPVRLDIYGSGADTDLRKLSREIEDAGLEKKIQLMGYRDSLEAAFGQADMLLITSKMETFGRVAVEAMLAGCPVVSSNAGALPEIVRDGETGLIYRSGDPEHLARQVQRLRDDVSLRNTIITKAREYAMTRYSAERMVTDIDRILQEMLADEKDMEPGDDS